MSTPAAGTGPSRISGRSVDLLTPVLTKNWGDERAWKLTNYEHGGGYAALRTALDPGSG